MSAADLTIAMLADSEAELCERMVSYRELACAAVAQLHDLTGQYKALQSRHLRVCDEYRVLRAATMRQATKVAA